MSDSLSGIEALLAKADADLAMLDEGYKVAAPIVIEDEELTNLHDWKTAQGQMARLDDEIVKALPAELRTEALALRQRLQHRLDELQDPDMRELDVSAEVASHREEMFAMNAERSALEERRKNGLSTRERRAYDTDLADLNKRWAEGEQRDNALRSEEYKRVQAGEREQMARVRAREIVEEHYAVASEEAVQHVRDSVGDDPEMQWRVSLAEAQANVPVTEREDYAKIEVAALTKARRIVRENASERVGRNSSNERPRARKPGA